MFPIGGYFELEKSDSINHLLNGKHAYQSARASLYHLLSQLDIKRLWLPSYICDSVVDVVKTMDFEVSLYSINTKFELSESIQLRDREYLLCVNYFGINSRVVDRILTSFAPEKVIVDCSQALFYEHSDRALASIYSPRKFVGIPDGGLLKSSGITGYDLLSCDQSSNQRSLHLKQRQNGKVAEGYVNYQKAEASLSSYIPLKMSLITQNLLSGIDLDLVKNKRRENFLFLHQHLKSINKLTLNLEKQVPLCYPLLLDIPKLREKLIAQHVYVPCYWPELKGNACLNEFESSLVNNLLPIPCDQRYEPKQLLRVVELIMEINHEYSG